jgi:VIT1/CCC1 family predicted Fe2+/Mn2+ transporter
MRESSYSETTHDKINLRTEKHITEERNRVSLLGEVRSIIFGAQDGLISILGLVASIGAATNSNQAVLIGGLGGAFAGMISMAAGEYISTKSQRDVYKNEIAREVEETESRPEETYHELRWLFEQEGMSKEDAELVARKITNVRQTAAKTMIEKELGIVAEDSGSPLRSAGFIALAYFIGAAVPVLPFVFLPVTAAVIVASIATLVALFAIGASKAKISEGRVFISGLEVAAIGALAAIAGYIFGSLIPGLLGLDTKLFG